MKPHHTKLSLVVIGCASLFIVYSYYQNNDSNTYTPTGLSRTQQTQQLSNTASLDSEGKPIVAEKDLAQDADDMEINNHIVSGKLANALNTTIDMDESDKIEKTNIQENRNKLHTNERLEDDDANTRGDIWTNIDANTAQLPERDNIKNKFALHMDIPKMRTLKVRDEIQIPVPQEDTRYSAIVKSVITHANGDVSIIASFPNFNEPYSILITSGVETTYANVSTPHGSYRLEAWGSNAWLLPEREMNKQLDKSEPDFLIEDEESQENTQSDSEDATDLSNTDQ